MKFYTLDTEFTPAPQSPDFVAFLFQILSKTDFISHSASKLP